MKTTIPKLRKIIRNVIQEHVTDEHHTHGGGSHGSKASKYDSKINKAKEYIGSDQGLYYSLRQSGHPFSVAHYSLEPTRTRDQIMNLLDNEPALQGHKVIGEISNTQGGFVTYLLSERPSYDYVVLHIDYDTDEGIIASGFGSDFSMLKSIVRHIQRPQSSDPELDQYISQF